MYPAQVQSLEPVNPVPIKKYLDAILQITAAIHRGHHLNDVLLTILDTCSRRLAFLYPSVAILQMKQAQLVGRVVTLPECKERVQEASKSTGISLDHLFGTRGERRIGRRDGSQDGSVPPEAISCPLAMTESAIVQAYQKRRPIVTARYFDLTCHSLAPNSAAALQQALGIEKIMVLPLQVSERCVGVIAVALGHGVFFTSSDHLALRILAGLSALAVETTGLQDELLDREKQVVNLLRETVDAQESERERICLDIHDGLFQTFTAALHHIEALDDRPELSADMQNNIRKAVMLLRSAVQEAREVIRSLRPATLDSLGLIPTLLLETTALQEQMGWKVDFDASVPHLPKEVETALYRVVHEAFNNIAKHAQATQVVFRMKREQSGLLVEIYDNGMGFDYLKLSRESLRKGIGLFSMRKRCELLNGTFDIESIRHWGTKIVINVPLTTCPVDGDNSTRPACPSR